jgi:glycosyltransferase involved in cell wall biosynthesis
MRFSVVVPVFNRPDEVDELLESLTKQTFCDFEVIIVEDGSYIPCKEICSKYDSKLNLKYFEKENSGPGQSRNFGAERASGDFLLILDSDVILPETYMKAVSDSLEKYKNTDAFGGPDKAHPSFTATQKAISYSMTAFFTTGGIRGGKKKLDKFYPRSFNMGIRKEVYEELGGFSKMRFGEDIDFSIRIFKAGYNCRLFPEAWVWHKRRTDFRKFYRQVYNSGIARINLYKKYSDSLKPVHLLPTLFTVFTGACLLATLFGLSLLLVGLFALCRVTEYSCMSGPFSAIIAGCLLTAIALFPLIIYSLIIFTDSSIRNKNLKVGLLSIPAAFVQLIGYGIGFINAWWRRCVRGKDEFSAFDKTFYK